MAVVVLYWFTRYCLITAIESQYNTGVRDSQGSALIKVTWNKGKLMSSKTFREELFMMAGAGRACVEREKKGKRAPGTDGQTDLLLAPPMLVSRCIPPTSPLSHLRIYVIIKSPNCGAGSHAEGF